MEPNLFRYIWVRTWREQVWIVAVILCSVPFEWIALYLPKEIVNGPLQGGGFEAGTRRYLHVRLPLPTVLAPQGGIDLLGGFELTRVQALVALSLSLLALVVVNGLLKRYFNTYKGRLGERMLAQLRYELIDRVLRFPLREFRRVKGAEVATIIRDEVEPLGSFIGDAIVQPVLVGRQIASAAFFIVVQDAWLGAIAVILLAIQGFVIPRLRRRQLALGRRRQKESRALAGAVGEVVDGIVDVHANGATDYVRALLAARLVSIFDIRFELYERKFFVNFLNNLLSQATPFLFYLVGGLLAISGRLDLGQLVAVIAAYKDLPSPVKDLIAWDQQRLDVEVKYEQIVEQFSVDPSSSLLPPPDLDGPVPRLVGEVALTGASLADDDGRRLLDRAQLRFDLATTVAVVGRAGDGAEALMMVLGRRRSLDEGRVTVGGVSIDDMPRAVTDRQVSIVGPDTFFMEGTIRDALLFGLRNLPGSSAPTVAGGVIATRGNSLDLQAGWVDHAAAGVAGPEALEVRLGEVLALVGLEADVMTLGFGRATPDDVAPRLPEVRDLFRAELRRLGADDLVEPFTADRYNVHSSIGDNLLFGTALDDALRPPRLAEAPLLREVLAENGLDAQLHRLGLEAASQVVDLFEGVEPDSPLFERLALTTYDRLPDLRAMLRRVESRPIAEVMAKDRSTILSLALRYLEKRDRLGLVDDELEGRIVAARAALRTAIGAVRGLVSFHDANALGGGLNLREDVLVGRVAFDVADAESRVGVALRAAFDALGLGPAVLRSALSCEVGQGGRRLASAQRQKLALARAVLRRPDLLLVQQGLSHVDPVERRAIVADVLRDRLGSNGTSGGVLWHVEDADLASLFDREVRMDRGKVVADSLRGAGREAASLLRAAE